MKELNVLVVDDEQYILNSLKRLLKDEPFEAFATTSYEEALSTIQNEKIKVVLSDQRMPNITGVEFLKKVKEKNPDIIRILFTGYADIKVAEEAINKGEVYRFINKPWNDEELKTVIRQCIDKFDLIEKNKQLTEAIQRQNEELLVLNNKLKNMYESQKAFSSTVSHELRTPLASIKMGVDLVLGGTAGKINDDQKKFLDKVKNNVDRLNRLINDILDLSRLESGKSTLNIKENDLNAVIKEVVETQKPVVEQKGLYLNIDLAPDIPKVFFDEDKIIQLLNNLISNANKFADEGGITVLSSVNIEGNHVKVVVNDTGCGIKEEDMPKLFQKFQQLGDPSERKTGGTGLGLAICKEIISQHNGKIWTESKSQKGSSFCFILPIKERRER